MELLARRIVAAAPERVFAFLAAGHNHWKLAGRRISVRELATRDGHLHGVVVIRGPLGMRRRARTEVLAMSQPDSIVGLAWIGSRTRARVRWTLVPDVRGATPDRSAATVVTLSARLERAALLDRLLLRCGGGWWMRRVFAATLVRLAGAVEPHAGLSSAQILPAASRANQRQPVAR